MAHGTAQGPSPTTTGRHAQSNQSSTPLFSLRSPASSAAARPLSIESIADVIATLDEAITPIQVKASGGSGSYTYWIGSNIPPPSSPLPESNPPVGSGLSIDTNGRITGTPTQTGTFTLTVAVRDGAGSRYLPPQVSRPFTMRVKPPVTVSAIDNITVTQNTAITPIQVSASGGQTPYSYSLSSNPATGAGLSINENSGQITGTPTQAGSFTLTVSVTDNASTTATESFSMAVRLIGDFNGDGVVNLSDHLLFLEVFGLSEGDDGFNTDMDLDGDGTIGIPDFLIFVDNFGSAARFF